jgi:DNA repair photolyase
MSINTNETIKKLDEQIAQLQARKKSLENKEKQKSKKERTKLLLKFGALTEKYLECETPEELEKFLIKLLENIPVEKIKSFYK